MLRLRPDDGFAMSSPLALLSAGLVLVAGVAYFATGDEAQQAADEVTLAAGAAKVERRVTLQAVKVKPTVKRDAVYVSVFNNTNVTGLAGATAERIGAAGWQVVNTDNWLGTIPATTIYYPPQLKTAAQFLSKDLGIHRVLPAVDPMSMDRLTVILTADFA